jgi:hypothetical protein
LEDVGLEASDLQSWEETFPMSPTEINSLQDALLVGAATTRGRQASLISVLNDNGLLQRRGVSGDGEDGDSGIGSEPTSGPSSGLTSGHGSHVLDTGTANGDLDSSTLLSNLSLNGDANATRTRPPFHAHESHKLHITSMEHGLMDQLAIRLLESIFFDNRQVFFFCLASRVVLLLRRHDFVRRS